MGKRSAPSTVIIYLLLAVVVCAFMLPIFWMLLLSIRPAASNLAIPPKLFFKPTLKHFSYCFVNPGVSFKWLINSLVISCCSTLLAMPFSLFAAYAFSRFNFRLKKFLMFWYLGLFLGPPIVFLIPYVILLAKVGLVGKYPSMIIVYQTFTIPFSILVMKSFLDEIPYEIEESALVDGAGRLMAIFRIVVPLALPGIIVASMFSFVFSWNNAAFPLVLSAKFTKPLPVGTLNFFATTGITWNYIGVSSIVTMLPPMLIFLSLEKYIVRGLTFGAVKG
jgi:multiple sugar transport system permease protein